ncbi:MAG: ABC transporter permease [Clostridia bacterium]|nr:ABC transporter permease [Clostridia bacterium]
MADLTKKHEPLIRLSKNDDLAPWKAWCIRLGAVAVSILLCAGIVVLLTDINPIEFFKEMIDGSFGSTRKFFKMLQEVAILLCISLAVTPAFKMKFWNTGAEGQVLVGALATAACMKYLCNSISGLPLFLVMFICSVLAGMVWGIVPAFFKAHFKTNETLFTLMMNYIAIQLVAFMIAVWVPSGSQVVGVINRETKIGWLPDLFGQKYIINVIIVLVITLVIYIYLRYSKHGYEISVVGESENTARYIGINVKKVILRTMAVSGAICGIAGFLLVAGTDHSISTETAGGDGFTAIMVSWLAKFNPFVMMVTSFIISFLRIGAGEIASSFNLNESVAEILTGIIIFFIIGSEFFINYKVNFRTKQAKEHTEVKQIEESKEGTK